MHTPKTKVESAAALPVIQVTWVDAYLNPEDSAALKQVRDIREFGELPVVQDVGYLVRWNAAEIVLAVSRCNADNDIRHSNTIPRSLVRGIDVLAGELPCPMTALIPSQKGRKTKARPTLEISRHGSSNTSASTSQNTVAYSTTKPRMDPSPPSSSGPLRA